MARSNIAAITPDADGTLMAPPTAGDAVNGHTFNNTGRTMVLITNSGASPRLASYQVDRKVQNQTVPAVPRTLAAGERWLFGNLPVEDFGRLVRLDVAHSDLKIDVIEP